MWGKKEAYMDPCRSKGTGPQKESILPTMIFPRLCRNLWGSTIPSKSICNCHDLIQSLKITFLHISDYNYNNMLFVFLEN